MIFFWQQVSENKVDAECRVRMASAVRTAVVRDRQESEQVSITYWLRTGDRCYVAGVQETAAGAQQAREGQVQGAQPGDS